MNYLVKINSDSTNNNTPYMTPRTPQAPAASYGATIGVAIGMAAGITYRLWNQAPFALNGPVQLTSVVHTFIISHLVHVVPWVARTWNNGKEIGFRRSINNEIHQLRPREIARTLIPTAVAATLAHTQAQWVPTVAKVLTMGMDTEVTRLIRVLLLASSHLLFPGLIIKTNLTAAYRIEGEDKDSETSHFVRRICALTALSSMSFQLGKEVVSGSLLALSAIGAGSYISKGLPRLLAGTITAISALVTPSTPLGGALWIAHAGFRVLTNHYLMQASIEYRKDRVHQRRGPVP